MTLESWLLLVVACCGACIIPGPNTLIVVNHATRFGVYHTLWTILGGVFGFILLMTISVLGLGTVVISHPFLIEVNRNIGSLYLVMLGVQLWNEKGSASEYVESVEDREDGNLLKKGFISAVTNVNALLFFMSVMPNFVVEEKNLSVQAIESSLTLAGCEFFFELVFAVMAAKFGRKILKSGKVFNRVCGVMFFVFAIALQFKNY